jgi:hypothetical protein
LGIILTVFLFFYFPAEGVSESTFWSITGVGTALSLLVGWWLYRHSRRRAT